jgi:hypothetical protein
VAHARSYLLVLLSFAATQLSAADYEDYPRESLEIGYEQLRTFSQDNLARASGVLFNYYPTRGLHIGSTQNFVARQGMTDSGNLFYRPDIHLGVTIPMLDSLFAEFTLGVDVFTGLAIAWMLSGENNRGDASLVRNASIAPMATLGAAMRVHIESVALKFMTQFHVSKTYEAAYIDSTGSAWLGIGATIRLGL